MPRSKVEAEDMMKESSFTCHLALGFSVARGDNRRLTSRTTGTGAEGTVGQGGLEPPLPPPEP